MIETYKYMTFQFPGVKIGEQIQKNSLKCRPVDSWISPASRKTRKAVTPPGCSLIEETEGRSGVTVVIAASFGSQTQIDVRLRSPRDKWALTILLGRHTPSPSVHWSAAGPFTRPLALRTGGFTGDKAATLWVEEWGRLVIPKDKPLAFSPFSLSQVYFLWSLATITIGLIIDQGGLHEFASDEQCFHFKECTITIHFRSIIEVKYNQGRIQHKVWRGVITVGGGYWGIYPPRQGEGPGGPPPEKFEYIHTCLST